MSTSSPSLYFFFLLFVQSAFLLSLFPYFTLKLFRFFCFRLLVYPCAFSTYLLVGFSFVILKYPVLFAFPDPISVSLESHFVPQCLLSCPFNFSVVLIESFHPNLFLSFSFLHTSACCHRFFTYPFSLISQPAFIFLFMFLKGNTDFFLELIQLLHELDRLLQ